MKKIIKLKNGAIELTILRDGALLLAEVKRGYIAEKELKFALNAAGYSFGLIEQSITSLEKGHTGQILLATAITQYEPAGVWNHSGDTINKERLIENLKEENFNFSDISFDVKKNERLLTITTTPKIILRYPDGRKIKLKDLGIESVSKLCGSNTCLNVQSKSIFSGINGSLHRSIYGVVSSYPQKTYSAIERKPGKVSENNAIWVEQDIASESYVDIPSNLIINGSIISAIIEVGGNIVCHMGMDNSRNLDTVSVVAGQSIFTSEIKKYPVWSGSYILVNKIIEDSTVQCLDTIAVPVISRSEIRVGNKLYVKDILKGTDIFLGNAFVENEELRARQSFHIQHKKRMIDLENKIIAEQLELESNRSKAIAQIKKIRGNSKGNFSSDMVLNRFLSTMTDGLKKVKKKIEDYEATLKLFEKESRELSFFEQQLNVDSQPEIIVLGKIQPGVIINAENQVLKINEELKNVSIKLDTARGILNIQPLRLF